MVTPIETTLHEREQGGRPRIIPTLGIVAAAALLGCSSAAAPPRGPTPVEASEPTNPPISLEVGPNRPSARALGESASTPTPLPELVAATIAHHAIDPAESDPAESVVSLSVDEPSPCFTNGTGLLRLLVPNKGDASTRGLVSARDLDPCRATRMDRFEGGVVSAWGPSSPPIMTGYTAHAGVDW